MDLSIFAAPIASGLVGAVLSAVGVYVAITNRLTKTETLIADLTKQVEKHNNVIERTYKLEARVDALETMLQ